MTGRIRSGAFALVVAANLVVAAAAVAPVSAFAFTVSGAATVEAGNEVLLAAGGTSQSINSIGVAFVDAAVSHVWSANDTIAVQLWDGTIGAPLSNTSTNAFMAASFAAVPSITATNNVDASYYGVALSKGVTSSVNDEFVLTLKKDAPEDAGTTKFTVSGLKVTLGSRIPAGHHIQLKLTASNGSPFQGAASTAFVDVGVVPATAATVAAVATGAPGYAGLALGRVTVRDIAGAAVNAGDEIDLTLLGGFFSTAGAMAGSIPAGATPTITTVTNTSDTIKITAVKTSLVGDTLSLSGAKIALPTSAGEVYLVVRDKTTSTVLSAVGVATVVTQTRVGGTDRYFTASQLFDLDFSSATTAVLTSGANYPDALSAIYLAGQLGTGLLTTDPNTLPPTTRSELLTKGIATVYIVGGTQAVSVRVASQVASLHVANNSGGPLITVVRIAGPDRYATNNLVDTYSAANAATTAIIATGENFADALAVGPAVYKTLDPLILTTGNELSASAKATIDKLGITHAIVVGGPSAISSDVESALLDAGVTVDYRVAGTERTQTAADVAAWETSGLPGHDIYTAIGSLGFSGTSLVNIARGDSFADALAAGAVAGADQNVIILTSSPTTVGPGIPQYLGGRAGTTAMLRAIGQVNALSVTTINAAAVSLTQPLTLS